MCIVLISPTGNREKQIQLCAKWMQNQTYKGKVSWIIVDDCEPRTTDFIDDGFKENWTIHKVYPTPVWQHGQNTQGRNIAAGIQYMLNEFRHGNIEAVFIIEDDDYYKPIYLEEMIKRLEGYSLAGETHTVYYNVTTKRWVENKNEGWSSLFQTCFTIDILKTLCALFGEKFIDYALYPKVANKNLFRNGNLAVGIKGLSNGSSRPGLGAGHEKMTMQPDDGGKLFELIGDDAKFYL